MIDLIVQKQNEEILERLEKIESRIEDLFPTLTDSRKMYDYYSRFEDILDAIDEKVKPPPKKKGK